LIPSVAIQITDPLIKALVPGHSLWSSLEGENPGGSIKDRMVFPEISEALAIRDLRRGQTISEISSGSTALSLAFCAQTLGFPCTLFIPYDLDFKKKAQLRNLGATLEERDPKIAYAAYEEYCAQNSTWRLDQIQRPGLKSHYRRWGERELKPLLPKIDLLLGTVGTGLSLLGLTAALDPRLGCYSTEPLAPRSVQGIRNLRLESFGDSDPCPLHFVTQRLELSENQFFQRDVIETSEGLVQISHSFQVVLGALNQLSEHISVFQGLNIFLIGSHNRRI
jgi:cysteine synthase